MILCVIFGGNSSEYEVSLRSASAVIENIRKDRYDVIKIGVSRSGEWYKTNASVDKIRNDRWKNDSEKIIIDINARAFLTDKGERIKPDIIFPVMHGENVENGTLQGLFESMGARYIGCKTKASAVCFDKHLSKLVAEKCGIAVSKYRVAYKGEAIENVIKKIKGLRLPLFVKPAECGSSCGITKIKDVNNLYKALETAFKYSKKVLIEEAVNGKEIEISVLESNGSLIISDCGELIYKSDFYDYDTKYRSSDVGYNIPANIDTLLSQRIKEYAKKLFRALECSSLSRIDFFVTENEVIFNEINTMPGFTEISMYPMLLEKMGISFEELIDMLIKNVNFY